MTDSLHHSPHGLNAEGAAGAGHIKADYHPRLTNEDLALASAIVSIPCSPVQPTLNLSQAVLILAYELFLARGETPATVTAEEPPATAAELDGLLGHAAGVMEKVGFARDDITLTGITYDEMKKTLKEHGGFVRCFFNPDRASEARIKEETKATVRVVPFDQPGTRGKDVYTGEETGTQVLFAQAY